jgi:hypothetical protein
MKLGKLVALSDKMRKINSKFVRITKYKAGRDKQGFATAVCQTFTPREFKQGRVVPSNDHNRYVSSIKFIDKNLNVKVSCSCGDYCFRWEYANHKVGASDIIYCNGEPPVETNSKMRPGLCKHLLALRAFIEKKHGV